MVIFGKLLRACFIVPGPAKLKIVRVRSVLDDVSVPFASCPPNRRHSEYYSCQTEELVSCGFGSFRLVSTSFGWFRLVPLFSNYLCLTQGSYGILNTFFKDFSRTFPGQFMTFPRLFTVAKNDLGGTLSPPLDPGHSSGRGPGGKVPGIS